MSETPTESIVVREDGSVVTDESEALTLGDVQMSMAQLSELGIIAPIATPLVLRQAFAYKQRLYAAVLDPNDYLYTVSYKEGNKTRQYVSTVAADAKKVADTYRAPLMASPKKSGIVKLADALGIEAVCKERQGLPGDPASTYSYVVYEATHSRSGRKAEGVGWCDTSERGGRISKHDVIATADTRAYNRAVLRLSGFGDVSADEIIAGASGEEEELPPFVPDAQSLQATRALPSPDDTNVVTASRAWAEAVASRQAGPEGQPYLPAARQEDKSFRELRARARRGDEKAAQQLGTMGLRWAGGAQDGPGFEGFTVGDPPVTPAEIAAVEHAASPGNGAKKPGWDLSSKGSASDDAPAPASAPEPEATSRVPMPQPAAESITTAQAKKASILLMEVFGGKERARAWLKANAHVERSSQLRTNQYEVLINVLTEKKEAKSA